MSLLNLVRVEKFRKKITPVPCSIRQSADVTIKRTATHVSQRATELWNLQRVLAKIEVVIHLLLNTFSKHYKRPRKRVAHSEHGTGTVTGWCTPKDLM